MRSHSRFFPRFTDRRVAEAAFASVTVSEDPIPAFDPPLEPRDEAVFLLQVAAEVEHALMAQYLYAAYSLDAAHPQGGVWRNSILQVAREEMGHLLTVQNLLLAIGGPVFLERDLYPFESRVYPIPFELKKACRETIGFYVLAEMPGRDQLTPEEAATVDEIIQLLDLPGGRVVNRVGKLYTRLIGLVGALSPTDFVNEAGDYQASGADWLAGPFSLIVPPVTNREQAVAALHAIGVQGEGEQRQPELNAHFDRFLAIYRGLTASGSAVPVHAVADNPHVPALSGDSGASAITHPESRRWAQLGNLRYRLLLQFISHHLSLRRTIDLAGRNTLRDWALGEMRGVAAVAAKLTTLPLDSSGGTARAGMPFDMPYSLALPDEESQRWRSHLDVLRAASRLMDQIGEVPELAALRALTRAQLTELERRAGKILAIQEIRLLPPLAIGRLGSSGANTAAEYPDVMDNYAALLPDQPADFRTLAPAETLRVDVATGRVTAAETPAQVRFRGADGRIRPVAPFFEVWARFTEEGMLQPLTSRHLEMLGLTAQSVRWSVRAANLKAYRRTGDEGDRISASIANFNDHSLRPLTGTAANFLTGRSIPLGWIQYLQPTEEFPEIRARFTPGLGRVYGASQDFEEIQVVYNSQVGSWDTRNDQDATVDTSPVARSRRRTSPVLIYARQESGPNEGQSLGYLDDTCDGILEVSLDHGGRTLRAMSRFSSGPPDFAPDSFHVRTVQDDLLQMAQGPSPQAAVAEPELADHVIDVLRRAVETVRLMDTDLWNRRYSANAFPAARVRYFTVRGIHEGVLTSLQGLKEPAGSPGRLGAVAALRRVAAMLRPFDRDRIDFTAAGRQRMPAMMRGANGLDLVLSRRQMALIDRAIEVFSAAGPSPGETPESRMLRMISTFSGFSGLHGAFSVPGGPPLSARFSDPPEVLEYLRSAPAQGSVAGQLGLTGRPLVARGQPDQSAFVSLISNAAHPMNPRFLSYSDEGRDGIQIVREWITSLGVS